MKFGPVAQEVMLFKEKCLWTAMDEDLSQYLTLSLGSGELKKGVYHIPGGAEKGGYLARRSVLCHI